MVETFGTMSWLTQIKSQEVPFKEQPPSWKFEVFCISSEIIADRLQLYFKLSILGSCMRVNIYLKNLKNFKFTGWQSNIYIKGVTMVNITFPVQTFRGRKLKLSETDKLPKISNWIFWNVTFLKVLGLIILVKKLNFSLLSCFNEA